MVRLLRMSLMIALHALLSPMTIVPPPLIPQAMRCHTPGHAPQPLRGPAGARVSMIDRLWHGFTESHKDKHMPFAR